MNYKKDILIIAATHGNEQFSVPGIEELKKQYPGRFNWLIGNERAVKQNVRFIDADLNRSAPGNKDSVLYEQRRAWQLINVTRQYRYVIDVHGTPARTGLFAIVCNPKPENVLLAASLPIQRVVIWSDKKCDKSGPLTQFVPCGLEIECGPKDATAIKQKLYAVLEQIISSGISYDIERSKTKQWFRVYGRLESKPNESGKLLQEFAKTKINKEVFYPLLIGRYQNVSCYKMEKINWWDLFSF